MVKHFRLYILAAFLLLVLCGVIIFNTIQFANELEQEPVPGKEIEFMHWAYFPEEIFEAFHKEFPNITVNYHRYAKENYSEIIRLKMLSGEQTDVIGVLHEDYTQYADKGILNDLTEKPFLNAYKPDVRNAVRELTADREYAVAYRSVVYGIWYNQILFSKLNLEVPLNFNQFLAVCNIFKIHDINPVVFGGRDDESASDVYLLRLIDLFDDGDWRYQYGTGIRSFLDEESQKRIGEMFYLTGNGYIAPESLNLTSQQAFEYFKQSRAAMLIAPDYSINLAGEDMEKVVIPGVGFIPYADEELKTKVPVRKADNLIAVYSGTGNTDACMQFMEYLSRPETALLYSQKTFSFPTVKGVSTDHLLYNSLWEPLRKMESVSMDFLYASDAVKNSLQKKARLILAKVTTPQETAEFFNNLYHRLQ